MANKKINQLVSKTSILSTDLFGIGDATTGQLFKKTIAELQAAIGGAVISVNGLVGTVVLDTDDIQELATPTNKWFTDARARAAISLTVTGNSGASTYSSGTGVLNVPTYTLAGLGGITATFLSGGTGISYNSTTGVISYSGTVYTDASIRALFTGGTGITYNNTTGAITYSGTVYTDSSIRALISLTTTGNSGASTYNNTTGVINVPNYTLAGLGGISLTSLSGGTGMTYNSSTGEISYSGTVYTDSSIRGLISATSPISYNSTTGVISLTSGNLTEATSSVLTITGGTEAVLGSGTSIQVKQATTLVSGFLSSTDWNTFNNKQGTITLTTTGTSGNATFSSGTLNIPNYGSALSGYLPLTGGTLTGALFGTTASFSSSVSAGSKFESSFSTTSTLFDNSSYLRLINTGTSTLNQRIDLILRWQDGTYNGTGGISMVRESATARSGKLILASIGSDGNSKETIFLTSAGNVGVGTTTPAQLFHIASSTAPRIQIQSTTNSNNVGIQFKTLNSSGTIQSGGVYYIPGTTPYLGLTGDDNNIHLSITSAGNIGIGTDAPSQVLHLRKNGTTTGINIDCENTSYQATLYYSRGGTGKWEMGMESTGENWYIYGTGYAMTIVRSSGNVLIGTQTNNGEKLYVSGAIRATGTITANSDINLKKNLLKIENALEKVEQINGYTYEFKADDSKRHAGVIAQEIQTVLPEIVNKGNDGILGVEYGNISALLIEAIKEQNIKIKNLETLLASK